MSSQSPAAADAALVERYLAHAGVLKRYPRARSALYRLDLDKKLARLAAQAGWRCRQVQHSPCAGPAARMHAGGRSGRGIALILSGWRGFYAWLGREGLIAASPVQGIRAPRQPRRYPRRWAWTGGATGRHVDEGDDPWLDARCRPGRAAVRQRPARGRAEGLDVGQRRAAEQTGRGWIDLDPPRCRCRAGAAKRRAVPLGTLGRGRLRHWLALRGQVMAGRATPGDATQALFIGRRGTRLSAPSVWQRLRRRAASRPGWLRRCIRTCCAFVRQPCVAVQRRSAHPVAGTAGPCQHRHHADLHTRLDFQHPAQPRRRPPARRR